MCIEARDTLHIVIIRERSERECNMTGHVVGPTDIEVIT